MKQILILILSFTLTACSGWVFKIDIPQGNFLNQDDVDKLRVEMTQEQVEYVLGTPLISNPFKADKWHYVYTKKLGFNDKTVRKELVVEFKDGKLINLTGDYERPENFDTPLDSQE